jgi:REP element-mobilizing transposase RayT
MTMLTRQQVDPQRTSWHITYGTRLHGSARPTVDKQHNQFAEPFLVRDPDRELVARGVMNFPPRYLTTEQRSFAETVLPQICERGGWNYRIGAAGPDHVHLLCDIVPEVHGEKVRRLVKRWLGQALSQRWPLPNGATWWAQEGSNKVVHDGSYLDNCYAYILNQRTGNPASRGVPAPAVINPSGAEDGPAR